MSRPEITMKITKRIKLLSLSLLLAGAGAQAAGLEEPDFSQSNPNVEEYTWSEEKIALPAFPRDEGLVEFQVDQPNSRFKYFIDKSSIAIGSSDGVTRFSLVVQSSSGSRNISYEALRCNSGEYKIYAFGSYRTKQWKRMRRVEWKEVKDDHYQRHRRDLLKYYLCKQGSSLTPEAAIQAMTYRQQIDDDRGFGN